MVLNTTTKHLEVTMSKLYTEEQVRRLLDMQKGNCYVAILTQTRDEKIASLAISAPLPGGDQFNEHFGGFELPTDEETYKELREEICNILNLLVMHYGYSTDEAADDILELIKPTNKVGE